jgi:putative hydrolase of HD superfamily
MRIEAVIDYLKLIKIALIHDLPAIYAGDTTPYRGDIKTRHVKNWRPS